MGGSWSVETEKAGDQCRVGDAGREEIRCERKQELNSSETGCDKNIT
jgi:hypothetical protein